jgi:GLPGLI family protein
MEHMADQLPSSRTTSQRLYFNEASALLKDVPHEAKNEDVEFHGDGGTMRFRMMGDQAKNETYSHFDEEVVIEKRDFMGRTFLITGTPAPLAWRLTDERSEFLGYLCQKAIATRDSTTIEAWFTPQIPVPAGPGTYSGLPGLILVVNENDGQRSIVAKELSLEPLGEDAIVAPEDGKQVTRAEFGAIVEEKMKEMGAERSGNGGARFIIRN